MTTKVKSSATSRKSGAKSVKVSANDLQGVVNSVSVVAPSGVGVTAGGSGASGSGVIAAGKKTAGKESVSDRINSAVMMEGELSIIDLRQKIASNWAAPEWSGAAALRASLAAIGTLSDEQINAAVAAAGRKSGEDLEAVTPSLSEVCDYISKNFASEFRAVCGCAVPAASAVRLYSLSSLSLSTITADSDINDYLCVSGVPSGLTASGLVSVIMSVRFAVDVRRRFAEARAAARNDFRALMAGAARRAARLGLSAAVAGRYFSYLLGAVPASDASEEKRLRRNLAGCWAELKKIELAIVMAAPAGSGAFGALEIDGGFVFPAAGLPASAPAKVRKMWAKRVRLLSSISTLNSLLARC